MNLFNITVIKKCAGAYLSGDAAHPNIIFQSIVEGLSSEEPVHAHAVLTAVLCVGILMMQKAYGQLPQPISNKTRLACCNLLFQYDFAPDVFAIAMQLFGESIATYKANKTLT